MNDTIHRSNERAAAAAFSKQAPLFDEMYAGDLIVQYKRKRVRDQFLKYLRPESNILELNAGTGDDAIFFARQGHQVHATDISQIMQNMLREKLRVQGLEGNISYELRSFTDLQNLFDRGPYDAIFSNFAGLNCTAELPKVLESFHALLKPGGIITLVILPKFCLWELMLLFRGKFRTAFRRFSGQAGSKARVEGEFFKCWYYNPSFVKNHLGKYFEWLSTEGLCTLVPPSYIEKFAERHATVYSFLKKKEEKWKSSWPWRSIGDYYIISFRKKG